MRRIIRRKTEPPKRKVVRKPRPPWEPPPGARNIGGCMFNPPKNCQRKDKWWTGLDGYLWIDLQICGSYCPKQCQQYLDYKKTWVKWTGGNVRLPSIEEIRRKSRD